MPLNSESFIEEFKDYIKNLRVTSILEVGSQTGELMRAVEAKGIDLEPKLPDIEKGDIREYKGKKYGLVFSSGLVEHYTKEEAVDIIKSMAAASRKYVLNYVPNSNCLSYMNKKKHGSKNWPKEWREELDYTVDELARLHEDAGLEVVDKGTAAAEWAKMFGSEPSDPYLVYCLAKK